MRILSLTLVLLFLFGCSKDEDTYKIYPSNTDSACEQLEEASGSYTEDGKKITFEKSLDFILEKGIPLKEANYTITDNVLTLSFDSLYNGITVKLTILLNKEDM